MCIHVNLSLYCCDKIYNRYHLRKEFILVCSLKRCCPSLQGRYGRGSWRLLVTGRCPSSDPGWEAKKWRIPAVGWSHHNQTCPDMCLLGDSSITTPVNKSHVVDHLTPCLLILVCLFLQTGFHYVYLASLGTFHVPQAGPEFAEIHLPLPSKCWD